MPRLPVDAMQDVLTFLAQHFSSFRVLPAAHALATRLAQLHMPTEEVISTTHGGGRGYCGAHIHEPVVPWDLQSLSSSMQL